MGNGSFRSDVIQSVSGATEKVARGVRPARSPVHSESAARAFTVCADATGKGGRRGDVLLHDTTCAHTTMPARSPARSKSADRTFADSVCADATRKSRRWGDDLIHMNAYILMMMYVTRIYTLRIRNKQLGRHSLKGS